MTRILGMSFLVAALALACLPGAAQVKLAFAQNPYVGPPIPYALNINLVQGKIILGCDVPANVKEFSYVMLMIDNQLAGMAGNVQNIEFPLDTTKLTDGLHNARAIFVTTQGDRQYSGEFYFTPANMVPKELVRSVTVHITPFTPIGSFGDRCHDIAMDIINIAQK